MQVIPFCELMPRTGHIQYYCITPQSFSQPGAADSPSQSICRENCKTFFSLHKSPRQRGHAKNASALPRWLFAVDLSLDNAHTVSICVVARIGTHGFSLVRSMGTQNSRGVVLLAILAKRLEILAVHTVFEPGLVNKDNHVGVFVPITIITAHDYFFNYTFKNMSVKGVQNLVLFKGLPERGNTLAHCRFVSAASCRLSHSFCNCSIWLDRSKYFRS